MTPQLQKAISQRSASRGAGIQSLSAQEKRQLLQILSETVNKYDDLEQQDYLFWQKTSLEDLIKTQKTPIIQDIKTLVGDYWEEDSIDEFLSFLKEQRQSGNSIGE